MVSTALISIQPTPVVPARTGMAEKLVEAFFDGRNARTLDAYRADLDDFRQFLQMGSASEAAHLLLGSGHGSANGLAFAYKSKLLDRNLQPTTINRRLAALRSLVKMANTLGMVPWELAVENVKVKAYRDTRGPGRSGFQQMLEAAEAHRDPRIRQRNVAILRLLHDLALRRGEVVGLDVADVDLERDTVSVLGKGRSQKELLSLPEPTRATLQLWLDERGTDDGPLFINYDRAGKAGRLTGSGLYYMIRGLGERTGIKARPHGLRHTAITEACKAAQSNGIDLEEVLDFSRHADVKTLMIYRDKERNMQGRLAALVATTLS